MNQLISNKYLTLVFRLALGIIFVYASLDKIAYPGDFATAIRNYKILPELITNIFAIILSWLELFCGIFLIVGLFTRASAFIISFMLVVFIIAIISGIARGLDISCGCFSTVDKASKVGMQRLLEDIGMLVMGLQIFFFTTPFISIETIFSKREQEDSIKS
jgi:uncharacterized membrane protein YphA (DoxX/SURF4 family)